MNVLLKHVALIKTDFEEADFWIQRKGSLRTVGTVLESYYSENIGIQLATDKIDPTLFRFAFENAFNRGIFKSLAVGSLQLQHIKVSDVRDLPLSYFFPAWF